MNKSRILGIPLLCMMLLLASCNLDGRLLLPLFPQQRPTLVPSPTNAAITPQPQPTAITERIRFPVGATAAQVSGQINGSIVNTYFLEASAGQRIQARVSSPANNVYMTVVSPGGTPLVRAPNGAQSIDQLLPESGDYRFLISMPAGSAVTTYIFNVSVTGGTAPTAAPPPTHPGAERIRFATGATSATVSGQVDGVNTRNYLLEASAGQRMQISVSSPTGSAYLTVVSPNGTPLARAQNGVQSFDQTLPESGDYRLTVSAPAGSALTNFTMTVSVVSGGSSGDTTRRITFAAGATSATVTDHIDGTHTDTYLLEASAGQRMQVSVTSPTGGAYLTVVSPGGTPLARAQAGAQSMDQTLPESGDYTIRVSAPVGTPQTAYTLNVSVTGSSSGGGNTTQRIRFAPGATSATVSGQIDGTTRSTYLLEASAGQRMQVSVTSPTGGAYLTIVSPNGTPLARAQNGVQVFDQTLPESGDYTIEVSAPVGTPLTSFTLSVVVNP